MPSFNTIIQGNQPIINVIIFPNSQNITQKLILSGTNSFRALVDTGATNSVLTSKTINTLGLVPIGKTKTVSASHVVNVNTYQACIGIPYTETVNT